VIFINNTLSIRTPAVIKLSTMTVSFMTLSITILSPTDLILLKSSTKILNLMMLRILTFSIVT